MVLGCVLGVIAGAAPHALRFAGLPLNWTLVAGAGAMLLAAFALRRAAAAARDGESSPARASVAAALEAVRRAPDDVRGLLGSATSMPIDALTREIDALIERDVYPVLEAQPALIAAQGFARYASHTGPWAAGERMLYRAWSAATDGHRPEAVASLREAIPNFDEARSSLSAG